MRRWLTCPVWQGLPVAEADEGFGGKVSAGFQPRVAALPLKIVFEAGGGPDGTKTGGKRGVSRWKAAIPVKLEQEKS
jgi:hypothetical protein